MEVQYILLNLGKLFILLFLGYFLVALKALKSEAGKHLSNFIFYVTMPCMVVSNMVNAESVTKSDFINIIWIALFMNIFLLTMAMLIPRLLRVPKEVFGLYQFFNMFGNVAFVAFPVLIVVLGREALFYAAVINMPYNFIVYSLGVYFITKDNPTTGAEKIDFKKFINPGLISTALGLILYFMKFKFPSFANDIIVELGDMTTPLSLIVIGISLYGIEFRGIFKKYTIFLQVIIRMLGFPTIMALVLRLVGLDSMVAAVAVILIGTPMAANTVILAQEYETSVLEASEGVFIATLFMAVSVPYAVFLINYIL